METSVLQKIQNELKAPKNQFNKFGGYNYRNAEDIQESLKPILAKYGHSLTIADEIVQVGNRIYIKALVRLLNPSLEEIAATTAYAREPESRKGMDEAQVTGATSSYARKYALGGMFLLDDTKDADSMESPAPKTQPKPPTKPSESKPNAKTPMQEYLDSMAKAKAFLSKLTGSDDIYYSALKYFDIAHANELKDPARQDELLKQLRTFASNQKEAKNEQPEGSSKPGNDGASFPPEEN